MSSRKQEMLHWKKDTELWHTRTECDQENHMIEIRQYSIRNFHIVISSNQRNGEKIIIDRRILEDLYLGAEKLALHFHHLHHKIWFTNQSILSATNKIYPFLRIFIKFYAPIEKYFPSSQCISNTSPLLHSYISIQFLFSLPLSLSISNPFNVTL